MGSEMCIRDRCEMAKEGLLAFTGGHLFFSPEEFRSYLKSKVADISACSGFDRV